MKTIYEYDFVRLDTKGVFSRRPEKDYREVIGKWAALGWRLVTIVTPPSEAYGVVGYYELVFERPRESHSGS